ncbi:MAG: hypothetical protein Q8R78_03745 [Candidatus Omnitrophota bacterium]|nr:hypothetical protein [Candidatus Omnitrophota bacterium]
MYLIDRHRALWDREIVTVINVRQRGIRSRVVLRDNSVYQTRTRPRVLIRRSGEQGVGWRGQNR